jgi:hypothetical protein
VSDFLCKNYSVLNYLNFIKHYSKQHLDTLFLVKIFKDKTSWHSVRMLLIIMNAEHISDLPPMMQVMFQELALKQCMPQLQRASADFYVLLIFTFPTPGYSLSS